MKKYVCLGLLLSLRFAWTASDVARFTYGITTLAGSASFGDDGLATNAQISPMRGVAADLFGNVYLSDTDHNCVRKIDARGVITTVAGTGIAGFSGDGGPAISAQLNLPYGLATDLRGYLYIADLENSRIRRVSPDGTITTYAGRGGQGSSGDGGPASSAQLLSPRNVTLDAFGNLYIAEFAAHRVRRVSPSGTISTVAGTGIAGFRGDGGPATAAQLAFPAGLSVDRDGNLYIADSQNQRIRKVLGNGQIVTVLGGSDVPLLTPSAVAVDGAGDLFIADNTPTVHEWTVTGKWMVAAGMNQPGFLGDGGPASSALLIQPLDLSFDSIGDLYIADQHRLRKVNTKGIISTVAGANYMFGIGDGGAATAAELYQPSAVALDSAGNLYVADTGTNRVRQVAPSGTITTVAGTGTSAPGREGTAAVSTPLMIPTAVAVDPFGNLLIVENGANRIRQVAADGRIRTIVGTGEAGLGPDQLPPAQTILRAPQGVCLDRVGNLYVVDTGNSRVLLVPPGGLATSIAGNGAPGFSGDDGAAPLAQLNRPTACAADSAGDVYIADTNNQRVRKVDATGRITTIAGGGAAGSDDDGGPATSAALDTPRGIAVDDNGNVFISDTGNQVIRQVTADGTIHTIGGTNHAGYGGDGGPALSADLHTPGGILLDGAGDLYFADTDNNRVRVMMPTGVIAPPSVIPPTALSVANAASLSTGPVAPGEVVTLFGSGLGPQSGVSALIDPYGTLATQLAGVQVLFDGVAAPLFYVQSNQINAQVPYPVAGAAATNVQVLYQGESVGNTTVLVAGSSPGVFPTVVNQDGTYNSAGNPASCGSYLTIFATGEGLTNGSNVAGQASAAPYAVPILPVKLTVAGVAAQITWVGSAPGLVGLLQINFIMPGPYLPFGAVPLELTVGDAAAPLTSVWVQ